MGLGGRGVRVVLGEGGMMVGWRGWGRVGFVGVVVGSALIHLFIFLSLRLTFPLLFLLFFSLSKIGMDFVLDVWYQRFLLVECVV